MPIGYSNNYRAGHFKQKTSDENLIADSTRTSTQSPIVTVTRQHRRKFNKHKTTASSSFSSDLAANENNNNNNNNNLEDARIIDNNHDIENNDNLNKQSQQQQQQQLRKHSRNRKFKKPRPESTTTESTLDQQDTTNSYNSPYIILLDEYSSLEEKKHLANEQPVLVKAIENSAVSLSSSLKYLNIFLNKNQLILFVFYLIAFIIY